MEIFSGFLDTSDDNKIAFNHYKSGFKEVLIIAHGWFMTKDSEAFSKMSEEFSKKFDVICFDFRGHGKSSGVYTFGAKETKDLSSVVEYAKEMYQKIYLIGFSLGSLISINYCAKHKNIDKLIVVSAPVLFEKIENNVFSPNAFIPTLKKFELTRWLSIRFVSPFLKKPKPIKLIKNVDIPIYLIAGEKDPVIKSWHNEKLFKVAKNPKKQIIIKQGRHAEDLFLEQKEIFVDECLKWLCEG